MNKIVRQTREMESDTIEKNGRRQRNRRSKWKLIKILLTVFICLFASKSYTQTWQIGSPNAASLTATLSGDDRSGYTLTISGTGDMKDFTAGTTPWYSYANSYEITHFVIQPGVTHIGAYAFYKVGGLMQDTLSIPNSVTSIGASAFESSGYLWSDATRAIVTVPNSVTTIEKNAFKNCYFSTFKVDNANSSFSSEDGVLFDREKTILISCLSGKIGSYTTPSSVTSIGDYAFSLEYSGLNLISLSDRLTSIGVGAFSGCSIDYIKLPKSLTKLAGSAFANCSKLNTVEVEWDAPLTITSDVFTGLNLASCTLLVPIGKTAVYKAANVWKSFGNFKEQVSVTGISLDQTSATLTGTGLTLQLKATVTPTKATYQTVVWTSSNPNVATVSATGLVTSETIGTTIITAKTQDGGYSANCALTVQYVDGAITNIDVNMYDGVYDFNNISYKTVSDFDDPVSCLDFSKDGPYNLYVNLSANSQKINPLKVSLCVPKKAFADLFTPASSFYLGSTQNYYLNLNDGIQRFPTIDDLVKVKEFTIDTTLVWNSYSQNYQGEKTIAWNCMTDPVLTNGISYPVEDNLWLVVSDAQTGEVLQINPQQWIHVSRLKGNYVFSYTPKANSVVCDVYFTSQIPIKKAIPFIGYDCAMWNADYSLLKKGGIEKMVLSLSHEGVYGYWEDNDQELSAYQVFDNLTPDNNGIYHISWEIKDLQGNFYNAYKLQGISDDPEFYAQLGLYVEGDGQETFNLGIPEYGGQYHSSGEYQSINQISRTPPQPQNPNATVSYSEFDIDNGVLMHYHGNGGDVVVPNSVNTINDMAFYRHTNIQTVTVPASVKVIGNYAFALCSGLTTISVAADNQNYCSDNGILFSKDKTVLITFPEGKTGDFTVPNSVQTIGDYSFAGSHLTSVTIPNSVKDFGDYVFIANLENSTAVNNIYVNWAIPPVMQASYFLNWTTTLHVPVGTKELYSAANYWKNFSSIVETMGTSITNIPVPLEINAYLYDGRLYVNSPVAEAIQVYSVSGVLLCSFQKPVGQTDYLISQTQGLVLIVKGGSGWVKKIMK